MLKNIDKAPKIAHNKIELSGLDFILKHMYYFLKTLGCQINQADSERIDAILTKSGLKKTTENRADFRIINVCSVRQRAVDRVLTLVHKWQKQKAKIILTGCILTQDQKKLKNKVDLILGIQDIAKLPSLLKVKSTCPSVASPAGDGRRACQPATPAKLGGRGSLSKNYLGLNPQHQNNFQAYVPVMNGCNNFCSYCVVPYTRGREYSRPAMEIISEVKNLIQKGYKEIILLGQNVNSYLSLRGGDPKEPTKQSPLKQKGINFPKLLKIINAIPGNFWIRFMTSHPKDMSDDLINTIAQCEKVCKYIHLPIQSGNDEILKKMNRKYTVAYYFKLIQKIRKKIPDVAISTDIIVGFPGETKKQFQNTVNLFKKTRFDMAYLAQYSPRPGTAAYQLRDNVSIAEKKRRFNLLNQLLKKIAAEKNQKLVGEIEEVLVEKCQAGFCLGKTRGFKTVKLKSPLPRPPKSASGRTHGGIRGARGIIGRFIKVEIKKATAWGLYGEISKA